MPRHESQMEERTACVLVPKSRVLTSRLVDPAHDVGVRWSTAYQLEGVRERTGAQERGRQPRLLGRPEARHGHAFSAVDPVRGLPPVDVRCGNEAVVEHKCQVLSGLKWVTRARLVGP